MSISRQNNHYDCILIGAGIGSLVCGALLARKKLKVLIVEKHTKPGGYVTSYKRGGYHFDVPHVVSNVKTEIFEVILDTLNVKGEIPFIKVKKWQKWIYPDMEIVVDLDKQKLLHDLSKYFSEEQQGLKSLFSAIARISHQSRGVYRASFLKKILFPIFFPDIFKNSKKTFKEFLDQFIKNEKLKTIISSSWGYLGLPPQELSAISMCSMLNSYLEGGAWYPLNGYQHISDTFADRIREYGGEFKFKNKVSRILIENKSVFGIQTDTGEKFYSRFVVSGADSKKTFLNLVGKEYLREDFINKIEKLDMSTSGFSVHIGTKIDLSQYDLEYGTIIFNHDFDAQSYYYDILKDGALREDMKISIGICLPSLLSDRINEKGMHSVEIVAVTPNYDFWKNVLVSHGKEKYDKLKSEYADMLIKSAENVIPGLSQNIIVKDISTPLTYERYTDATNGAWFDMGQSVGQTGRNRLPAKGPLGNLYLTGSMVMAGGVMPCAISGLITAQTILRGKALSD